MSDDRPELVIPKEKAVFWLDGRGRWCNRHGVFRNRKISRHFHASIRRDEGGYYLCQEREHFTEKVYFPYEDTALFVVEAIIGAQIRLVLNTGQSMLLAPEALFVAQDCLYIRRGEESIKFTERVLMKLADFIDFSEAGYTFQMGAERYRIPREAGS